VLIGTGFSGELARHATWLVLPRLPGVPQWCFVALAVLAIDFVDWLAHLGNHTVRSLWRLHAVHHSQEELSILTTFRAHPLVHVSFLISAIPILAISSNAATPATVLTVYACLGALPHANLRWTYGRAGRVLISPAYHRIHHRAVGRLDINLGTVFAIWDAMSGRAVFPAPGESACQTGLSGRPVPVEQAGGLAAAARSFLIQWAEPFTREAHQ
jgi:sterol desaturase/sphingolipid hydroxylase (fatty acid hydroxylase superfamily)